MMPVPMVGRDAELGELVRAWGPIAGTGPAAVVVEDLHALDPASLNLIAELATTAGLPALIVVTSRAPEEGVSPDLAARALARLTGTPDAVRQHLGPLSPTDVAAV